MSCVIGIINKDGVWIGADSATTTESGEIRPVIIQKIFRNKNYLFAYVGSVRGGRILFPEYFIPPSNILSLPDAIIEQCRKKGCLITDQEDQTHLCKCNFLIGHKDKLYEILIDFQMNEIPEYTSIGSGSSYAFGSLYTTRKTNLKPEQRIKLALSAAVAFDTSTASPFIIEKL